MKQPDNITINVGTINGGTTPNTVPDMCQFEIDARFNDEKEYQEVDKYIKAVASKTYVKDTKTTLIEAGKRIAMDHKDFNDVLVDKVNDIYKECGLKVLKQRKANGGSDAAYTNEANIPTIDSIGVEGGYIHSKKEFAYLVSLKESAKRIASIIYGLND